MITIAQCVFDLTRAGAQQVVLHLATRRDARRFRVVVYAFRDGPIAGVLRDGGVEVRLLPQRWPSFDPTLVRRLARRFREDRVDLVHTHLFGADLHAGLAAGLAPARPAVTTVHCERHDNWRQRAIAGRLYGRFERIVAIAPAIARRIGSGWPRHAPRVVVIRNGVPDPGDPADLRRRARAVLGLPEETPVIGTVGRLTEQKAPLDLLEAFATTAKEVPEARLVFIGEGPLRKDLETCRARLGLEDRVLLAGSLPGAAGLVAAFDLFALPSRWEGLPMVLLEAMRAGVACVATDVGAVGEVLMDGANGRLLPPRSIERLAGALTELLRDDRLRAGLGAAGRRDAARSFDAGEMVEAYERLYDELCHGGRIPGRASSGA